MAFERDIWICCYAHLNGFTIEIAERAEVLSRPLSLIQRCYFTPFVRTSMQNQNEQGRKRANNNKIALEIRMHHRNIYMAQSRNYETHNHKRKVLSDVHTSASYQIFALFSVKLCGDSLPSPLSPPPPLSLSLSKATTHSQK